MVCGVQYGWRKEGGTKRGHVSRTLTNKYRIFVHLSSDKLKAVD